MFVVNKNNVKSDIHHVTMYLKVGVSCSLQQHSMPFDRL